MERVHFNLNSFFCSEQSAYLPGPLIPLHPVINGPTVLTKVILLAPVALI